MAMNFTLSVCRKKDGLHLQPAGDFDGSSAMQLLYYMRMYQRETALIVIDTERIGILHPFGLSVFRHNLGTLKQQAARYQIIGFKASALRAAWPPNQLHHA